MHHESTEITEQALTMISAYMVKAFRLGVNAARNNTSQTSPSSLRCGALAALKDAARAQGATSNLIQEAWRSGVIVAEKHG